MVASARGTSICPFHSVSLTAHPTPIALLLLVCVCVCLCAFPLTRLLVDISGEQPISRLLGIRSGEIELPKVGHVKDGDIVSTRETLALYLHVKTQHTHTHTGPQHESLQPTIYCTIEESGGGRGE